MKGKAAWDYQRSKSSTEVNSSSHSPTPSPVASPSLVLQTTSVLNSDLSHDIQSAPQTPIQEDCFHLTPNSNSEQSDLDFTSGLRLSTPNLNIVSSTPTGEEPCQLGGHTLRTRTAAVGQSYPFAQRRAKSTSSIQKDGVGGKRERKNGELSKDKRYSAIFATLR